MGSVGKESDSDFPMADDRLGEPVCRPEIPQYTPGCLFTTEGVQWQFYTASSCRSFWHEKAVRNCLWGPPVGPPLVRGCWLAAWGHLWCPSVDPCTRWQAPWGAGHRVQGWTAPLLFTMQACIPLGMHACIVKYTSATEPCSVASYLQGCDRWQWVGGSWFLTDVGRTQVRPTSDSAPKLWTAAKHSCHKNNSAQL